MVRILAALCVAAGCATALGLQNDGAVAATLEVEPTDGEPPAAVAPTSRQPAKGAPAAAVDAPAAEDHHAVESARQIASDDQTDNSTARGEVAGGSSIERRAGVSQVTGERIINLNGQEFKIRQPGNYTLLEMQRGASSVVLEGRVEAVWPCTLFVREVAVSGSAFGNDTLRVRAGGQRGPGAGLEVQMWQDGAWVPLANVSTFGAQKRRNFWTWLRPKLMLWRGRHQSDSTRAASGLVALKTYEAAGNAVEVLARKAQNGSHSAEASKADYIDIYVGESAIRVSRSATKRNSWLNIALETSGAAAPAHGSSGSLGGLLSHAAPRRAWLEPTKECARRLGRNIVKAMPAISTTA